MLLCESYFHYIVFPSPKLLLEGLLSVYQSAEGLVLSDENADRFILEGQLDVSFLFGASYVWPDIFLFETHITSILSFACTDVST